MPKTWTIELAEDENGDLLLPFPEDMLKILDWEEGTVICWEITTDNNLILKKKEDSEEV